MSLSPPDRTHDISNIDYHIKDLKTFGEVLTNAAAAAFPNRGKSRYRGVHVLLLSWEDDNLQVIKEVLELQDVFRINYGFQTEEWKIPSRKSHNSLAGRLLNFLDDYDDKENLLIVYYGGHGGMDDDRRCIWSCNGGEGSPEVRWFRLQTMLEEAKSDVLILLDCCAAASSIASVDSGITEVVAACGFETWTPGVGEHSFSRSLIEELKFLSTGPLFTAAMLHNKVLSRIKYWKPRYDTGTSLNPRDRWTEKRKTPVYILLASEAKQRSIELTPLRPITSSRPSSIIIPAPFPSSQSSTSLAGSQSDPDSMEVDSSQSSMSSVWPDIEFNCPKVLITVALEEDQWLETGSFVEWLKAVPVLARFAHVEGLYQSDSTLLIVSVPIAIWDMLPKNPALGFIGFIRSSNMLGQNSNYQASSPAVITKTRAIPVSMSLRGLGDSEYYFQRSFLRSAKENLYMESFVDGIGEWVDTMDPMKHFSRLLPCQSMDVPILRWAIFACGAQRLNSIPSAANFTDDALYYYRLAAKNLLIELWKSDRDITICAITGILLSIFKNLRPMELIYDLECIDYIAGARALTREFASKSQGLHKELVFVGVSITMEMLCCLHFNWRLCRDPGEYAVDMDFARDVADQGEIWVHRMVCILARICNFKAAVSDSGQDPRKSFLRDRVQEWNSLYELCDLWFRSAPRSMHPIGISWSTGDGSCFPEVSYLSKQAHAGQLFYHTAVCLLSILHPTISLRGTRLRRLGLDHSRIICGMAAHGQRTGLPAALTVPLRIAAGTLRLPAERKEITTIFREISKSYRCDMDGLLEDLEEHWAWSDVLSEQTEQVNPFVSAFEISQSVRRELFNPKMSSAEIWELLENLYSHERRKLRRAPLRQKGGRKLRVVQARLPPLPEDFVPSSH